MFPDLFNAIICYKMFQLVGLIQACTFDPKIDDCAKRNDIRRYSPIGKTIIVTMFDVFEGSFNVFLCCPVLFLFATCT